MGREVRRVPVDFDWPLGETWKGFLNPHSGAMTDCPECGGTGYSKAARRLSEQWYGNAPFHPSETGSTPLTPKTPAVWNFAQRNVTRFPGYYGTGERAIRKEAQRLCNLWNPAWSHHLDADDVKALVEHDRLMDFTHRPRTPEQETELAATGRYWLKESNGYVPTPQEVNEWAILSMGHDAINQWVCVRAKCERLKVPVRCWICDGSGETWRSQFAKLAYDAWQPYDPPTGPAYQIWETVSEGSPMSPPFETPEELADWMVLNDTTVTRDTNKDGWLKFICGPEWAPSAVSVNGHVSSGVAGTLAA